MDARSKIVFRSRQCLPGVPKGFLRGSPRQDSLSNRHTRVDALPAAGVPIWMPALRSDLRVINHKSRQGEDSCVIDSLSSWHRTCFTFCEARQTWGLSGSRPCQSEKKLCMFTLVSPIPTRRWTRFDLRKGPQRNARRKWCAKNCWTPLRNWRETPTLTI
jgi:hypothetical protein